MTKKEIKENVLLDTQVQDKSDYLKNKKIAFCVGGGIAAVEVVKSIRELRRHGATVKVYMSGAATRFITPLSLEWASAQPVVVQASGAADHIFEQDGLVVAPATSNTIGKVANGICDGVVTSLIASAFGKNNGRKVPIIFFPTMHQSLYNNPVFKINLKKLSEIGVTFFKVDQEENKLKIPPAELLAIEVVRAFFKTKSKKPTKLLITGSMVPSYLDQIRFVGNEASGQTAVSLVQEFYSMGYEPTILIHRSILGLVKQKLLNINVIGFKDFIDYQEKVLELIKTNQPELAVFSAGVSDFKSEVTLEGKSTSAKAWPIELVPNDKVIARVRLDFPATRTVAFKLLSGVDKESLFEAMNQLLKQGHYLVVGNLLEELNENPTKPKRYVIKNNLELSGYSLEKNNNSFSPELKIVNSQQELASAITASV